MDKKLLLKVIENQATKEEVERVLQWVGKTEERKDYYARLKNIWVSQHLSDEKASDDDLWEMEELIEKSASKEKKVISFKWISIAACILLLMSVFLNIYRPALFSGEKGIPTANAGDQMQLAVLPDSCKSFIYTVKGAKAKLVLPDSSVVWLNSDSKITYPTKFAGNTREVEISGEALFEVRKNPEIPMVVTSPKGFKVKVYGTKFNIKTYPDDNKSTTTLYSGVIELITKDRKGVDVITEVKPNQVFEIADNAEDRPKEVVAVNVADESAWQKGKLVFDETPLAEVIKVLERWHGTEFIIKNNEVLNCNITATFRSESIVQIMEMIKYCSIVDYSVINNGNTVELRRK